MIDVFRVADILVENAKAKYADDIAIIVYYGSYAQGTATPKSDLDFFYVPTADAKRPWDACVQFIIDGIGFDFWPIAWDRAERLANFDEGMTSLIADSVVLYHRTPEELERFNALKARVTGLVKPENGRVMLEKAVRRFRDGYMHLYNLDAVAALGDLTSTRIQAGRLVANTLEALALMNQTYFHKGWGQNNREVLALAKRPVDLEFLLDTITTSGDCGCIREACHALFADARRLLAIEQGSHRNPKGIGAEMGGFHEEAKGTYNKIATACDRGDHPTAFHAAVRMQNELAEFLAHAEEGVGYSDFNTYGEYSGTYRELGLPDLASLVGPDNLPALAGAVAALEDRMVDILREKGVGLNVFEGIGDFEAFIKAR